MAALDHNVIQFIVQSLVCFDTPTQVAEAVKHEYGLQALRQQVVTYDPTKYNGQYLSPKLRIIFKCTRERFLAEIATIPISNQSCSLRALGFMLNQVEWASNLSMVLVLLEQAAKEVGDVYLRRRFQT